MTARILVDMDGVLADVYSQFIEFEYRETGVRPAVKSLYGKLEAEAFAHGGQYVRTAGFFSEAPIMPGSVEGLQYLNDKYEVLVVSSATEFATSLSEKCEWLGRHYPFISWRQMVFCGRKEIIPAEIMLDDHPKNLDLFEGRKIIFTQPHNILIYNKEYTRVNNWQEIKENL